MQSILRLATSNHSANHRPEIAANILMLCPIHHAMFDYDAIVLGVENLHTHPEHLVDDALVPYHNSIIALDEYNSNSTSIK